MFKKIKERFSKRKRLAKKQPEILRYEELEQRVLFSADVVPGLDTAAVEEQVIEQDVGSDAQVEREAAPETLEQPSEEEHSELVLVNENVTDYEQLIADLQGGDNNRIIEVVVLESDRDGIEQVSEILSERSDLAAVHVISHGDEGQISLGHSWLNVTTLQQNRDAIAGWGSALSETGDILFYGCKIAADSDAQGLLNNIAELTKADVAASDDLTGSSEQGGDWNLEYTRGNIESQVAFGSQLQQSWAHVLAVAVDDSSSGSTADQASVTVSHTTSGTDRLMLVGVSMQPNGETVSSVTYNGESLTLIGTEEHSGGKSRVEIWQLLDPDTGTHDVVVNLSGTGHKGVSAGVMTFNGVNQTYPTLALSSDSGKSTTASTTVASATDDLVFGVVNVEKGTAVTPGAGQTEYWDIDVSDANGSGTTEAGAPSVVTSWTNPDVNWSAAAVSIQANTNSTAKADLSSVQDAYIQLKNPTTNDGTSGSMVIDRESTDLQRALVQFDLSSIPAGSTIQGATLKLEATAVGGELTIEAYQLLQSWSEGSTTWNESMSGTNWSTAGGSFNATALDSLTTSATGQHSFDITSLVQGWVDGGQQNHGVLVASPDGGGDRTVTYDSREGTVAPVLEIIYTNPANSAPVLDNTGIMSLSNVLQNSTDPNGDLVSAIITSAGGDRITDVDSGAVEGIAVTAVDTSNGTWEYSINGGSTWTSFGAVTNSSAVVLTDTANDRIRFVPNSEYTGNATITFRAWDTTDGNISGTIAVDTGTGGGTTAFSGVTETADIYVEPVEVLLWLSTTEDVGPDYSKPSSGVAGLPSWSEGEVFGMGNPNLFFGAGTTNGTFSSVFDFDTFAVDSDVDVTGMHYVTSDTSVTGAGIATGSIDLLAGDVIFITETAETLSNGATGAPAGWANNIATTGGNIYVFRAENTDDYSSGYFRLIMNDPATNQAQAVTLVESAVTIGDTLVDAGDFIYAQTGDADKNDIYWYDTSTVTSFLLIEGDDIAIDSGVSGDAIRGIELIEQSITIGGVTLNSGNILLTIDKADTTVGDNNLSVQSQDVFLLNVTATTLGSGTAAATAAMLFDGDGNVNFDTSDENLDALSLIIRGSGTNQAPVLGNTGGAAGYTENNPGVIIDGTITLADADSADFAGGILNVSISAGATPGDRLLIFNQGTGVGQIGVSGNDVTYSGVIIGTYSGGLNGGDPLVINLNANADLTATQALLRNITFWNISDTPATAARTVDFVLSDGDGGVSNIVSQTVNVTVMADTPVAVNDNHGLDFDGIDDYVSIADSASLTMTNTVTMEAWIKADSTANVNRMIINKEGEYEVALFSDGTINWAFASTDPGWTWHNTGYVVPDGEWTHIAVAYDMGKVSTYVNGTLVDVYNGSGPIGDAHATLDELRIGGRSNDPATKYFDGQIDDVRVWSTARTQVQIQTMMDQTLTGGESGLAGYWKFDEGSGTTVADSTGNGNNGTLIDGGAGTAGPQWTGYSTDQNTQINITAASGVVSNDIDVDGDSLTVTQVNGSGANVGSMFTLPSGAHLTVGTLGAFIYNPNGAFDYLDAGQTATDSFTYQIDDGNGGTDTAIATITINGVEDAPTATGNTVSTNEDTTYTFIASDFNFSDADGDTLASVKITSLEAVGSLQLSGGDVTLNQVISKAEIDSGLLKFIPIADENGPSYDSFQFTVNDGTVDSATPNTMTIDVTAINDDPTYAGSLPTDIPAIKETASNVDLSSIDLIDVDAAGGSLNFTLSTSASGTLSATPGGGVTVSGSGSTSMTLIGTLANLNTFLNNAANIQYTGPTDLSGNDVDTIQLDVTDNGNYGSGGGGTITLGTIKVDISNVTISATDASADETGSDAGQFTVDLGAVNNTGGDVTVSYTVTGTATATGDYNALSGSIVIADSQQTATIDVSGIVDDALIEGSETVIVTLTGTDNALFTIDAGNNSDTVTIADNDNALNSVSISATDPNAGETATDNGQFTVDLGAVNNTGGDVTVSYTVTGTATATGDYTALSGSIVIADSQQTATIDVSGIVDDALIEGNETVIVTLTGTDNALFTMDAGNNSDTVTIADNDNALNSVSISATDPNAGETATDNGQFTVDLGAANNTGGDVTVSYTVTGTATATGDYTALSGTVVIADGQQTATIDVSGIVDDALIEGSETVIVTLTGTDNALFTIDAGNNSDTVTIADNDSGLNSVSITATDPNAGETATDNGQFTVDLGAVNNTGGDVTVSYTVTGTATATGDYTALTGTVVIADGQQTATIDVSGIVDDALIEGSETVIVTLTGTDNALFTIDAGNNSATVTIADNDTNGTPVAADDAASGNEDNVIVGNVLSNDSDADGDTLTASLVIGPSNGSLTLNADGSFSYTSDADWSGTDSFTYTANDGTLDSNVATVTISVNPVDDTDPDDGGTATDPNPILEDPVADDDEDSDVENPTYETPGEDQLAEDEPLLLVEEYQAPEDSGTAYESIVKMKDPQDEETQEIILLTDEIDSNAQAEERDDDRGYTYYDNDLYKDMSSLKYWNLIDYAAQSEPVVVNLDDISFLDFDGDDSDPVIASDDYDSLRQEIDESFNSELKSQGIKAKIVTVTAATFTVGIVSYLLRAGSLVASMMSALPLWRGFDPIAIFSGDKKKKKKQNEMSDTGELNPEALFDGDAE